jgi:hypothetical protein
VFVLQSDKLARWQAIFKEFSNVELHQLQSLATNQ